MDENDKSKDVNKLIEALRDSSIRDKDYIKFVIGLSIGTLVFSGALLKEFIQFPQYKFILIIGWACFFISIILGVWILPGWDKLQSLIEGYKRLSESPEMTDAVKEKKLKDYYLRDLFKEFILGFNESDEKMKELSKGVETVSLANLKHAIKILCEWEGMETETLRPLRDYLKDRLKSLSFIEILEALFYPPNVFRKLRRTFRLLVVLEKVMTFSFFVGMFAILIFSINNLLR